MSVVCCITVRMKFHTQQLLEITEPQKPLFIVNIVDKNHLNQYMNKESISISGSLHLLAKYKASWFHTFHTVLVQQLPISHNFTIYLG